ncbi:hypothetical protein MUY27_17020 [Mucilaginibacter sp. RS28]|uniref:Uncharacterized protein n=1 Tax=Mucilaginibacter straminoryzae TaxID=2932774 RepID=A0A9X1X826_9SPHI|nr:hypothetical protein [Mucilaginibacter straminoryzae]MCJ8211423.1 hypothetical protein [Mucilaginibacter straminoryzae]
MPNYNSPWQKSLRFWPTQPLTKIGATPIFSIVVILASVFTSWLMMSSRKDFDPKFFPRFDVAENRHVGQIIFTNSADSAVKYAIDDIKRNKIYYIQAGELEDHRNDSIFFDYVRRRFNINFVRYSYHYIPLGVRKYDSVMFQYLYKKNYPEMGKMYLDAFKHYDRVHQTHEFDYIYNK